MASGATIRIAILANAAKAKAELDSVSQRTEKMRDRVKVAAAAAGVGIAGFAVNAVKQAADLNETLNKSSVIFGVNEKAMEAWASGAAKNVGLSKQAALETAAGFGDMFSQIGFGADQSAQLSKSTIQLAADLGSFNNLDTSDVLDRISGAYRGEYDSLQALIPNISAARVEQEAMALTHKKSTKELTAQDKALAVNAILNKDGARAVGDFAKTSSGAANQQKILKAEFDNLSAGVGQKLLPVLNLGLKVLGGVMDMASRPGVQMLAGGILALVAAVWAVNVAAKAYWATQMALNVVMMANPVGLVILAIAALVGLIVLAYKKSETFRRVVQAVWSAIKSAWGAIPGLVSTVVSKITGFFSSMKAKITGAFTGAKSWLLDAARDVIQGFLDGLQNGYQKVKDSLSRLTNMLPDWKGPASKDRNILRRSGRLVIGGFQSSLEDGYANVRQSLTGFTDSLGADARINGTVAVGGSAAGAQPAVLELRSSGSAIDDMLLELLRKAIRVRGGNVQLVLAGRPV